MIDVGSSQTTNTTSWDARAKLNTMSEIPAAVSMISTSKSSCSALKARISPACSAPDSSTMLRTPEAAGTILIPAGPSTKISSIAHSPASTCAKLRRTRNPSNTSTLARPRSASKTNTRCPCCAIATAIFNETLVLPTPPFPPVTAITFTTCWFIILRKPLA